MIYIKPKRSIKRIALANTAKPVNPLKELRIQRLDIKAEILRVEKQT